MKKKKYVLRGIDRRSNPLYRQEGTALDARNCLFDHANRLTKFPDFDVNIIPRGTSGEIGDFLNKLPFESVIIDLMPYDDHIVIATKVAWNNGIDPIEVNRFYKWFQSSNTINFIPFACETISVSTLGQIAPRVQAAIGGKLEYVEQENVLFFIGQYPNTEATDFSYSQLAKDNNLTPIFVYDGKVVSRAGCPEFFTDSQEDIGSLQATDDEYCRIVPFKLDNKNRWTFGNYSTHLWDYSSIVSSNFTLVTVPNNNTLDTSYGHQVYCRNLNNISLLSSDSPATRTIDVDIYKSGLVGRGYSVGVGQYLYFLNKSYLNLPFTPPHVTTIESTQIFRVTIEAVNIGSPDTIQIGEFKTYNSTTSFFEDSNSINVDADQIFSNIILALYGSKEYAFGYEFRTYALYAPNITIDLEVTVPTKEGTSTLTKVGYDNEFGATFISDFFEDMYDQETTKIIPPLVNSLVNYGSSLIMTDHENLYFSDLSVGGTLENITPFDVIPVGSSKRGPVTGVFANESFVTVFREEESYYISGNIFLGNYRIQAFQSTRIGCTDSRGIVEMAGAGVFPSKRGFYMCSQGGQMSELSDSIEPIFTDNDLDLQVDLTNVKAVVDFNREYLHFLVKSESLETGWAIFSYSYYFKEWLITDIMNGSGGLLMLDKQMLYSDGLNVFTEADTAVDAEAYYVSNFETLGDPSLRKKFLQALVFATSQTEASTITIENYKDWEYSDAGLDTSESEVIGGDKKLITRRLNPALSYSCAIKITSTEGNEMLIDGYEYEFGGITRMYKDEDN